MGTRLPAYAVRVRRFKYYFQADFQSHLISATQNVQIYAKWNMEVPSDKKRQGSWKQDSELDKIIATFIQ